MRARASFRALAVAATLATPAGATTARAAASTGGVGPDQAPAPTAASPAAPVSSPAGVPTGGVTYGARVPSRRRPPPPRGPWIVALAVSPGVAYAYGYPARVRLTVRGGVGPVRVAVLFVRRGTAAPAARVDLGPQPTGRSLTVRWTPGSVRSGSYVVRVLARDRRGTRSRVGRTSAATTLTVRDAVFPVAGPHSYGDASDRYGAPRSGGRRHAGQDILAAEGTPVRAVRGGTVVANGYGAAAGYFITLHGTGTGRDYFYAHLRRGTTLVREGQAVRTGQQLAQVGQTGDAIGSHLHFEIWVGPWFAGGATIDPLPDLLRWDSWS